MSPETASASHACFLPQEQENTTRLHLPIARKRNCMPKFAMPVSGRKALPPQTAFNALQQVLDQGANIDGVSIVGPGDPLATPWETVEALTYLRNNYPDLKVSITTSGLGGAAFAEGAEGLGLCHVTLLINAVTAETARKLYAWIRPGAKNIPIGPASELLVKEQAQALKKFKELGVAVKVATMVFPGRNDEHIETLAKSVAALGADVLQLLPYEPPVDDSELGFETLEAPSAELMASLFKAAEQHLPVLGACKKCMQRGKDKIYEVASGSAQAGLPKPSQERPYVAVASSDGFAVNMHLGQAPKFMIYGKNGNDGLVTLLEMRDAPEKGGGENRWVKLAHTLQDCAALLVENAGDTPERVLAEEGLPLLRTDSQIEGIVDVLYGGGKKKGKGRGK